MPGTSLDFILQEGAAEGFQAGIILLEIILVALERMDLKETKI